MSGDAISTFDWFRIFISVINVFFLGALFVARLQVKTWFLEQKESTQTALNEHNEDPGAHNNHSIAVGLEEKFNQMIEKVGLLTTQLAVLNERMSQERPSQKGGRR